MKRFRMSMRLICFLVGLVPMTTLAVISVLFFSYEIKTSTYDEVEQKLQLAATALQEYSIEDYKHFGEFSYYYDFIDSLGSQGVDLSLVVDDTRYLTTLKDSSGNRKEGSTIDSSIYKTIKTGDSYYSEDTVIDGDEYAIYYEPIIVDNEYIGAVASMQSLETIQNTISTMRTNMFGIIGVNYFVYCLILIFVTHIISKPLKQVASVLNNTSNGKLDDTFEIKSICKETVGIIDSSRALNTSLGGITSHIYEATDMLNQKSEAFSKRFDDISDSVRNMNTAIEEVAQGSTSQAQDTESIASQVQDMSTVVDNTNNEVQNLEAIVDRMKLVLTEVDKLLNNMIKLNTEAGESIEVVNEQTKATNMSAMKIKEAVAVIQDIASQTNLLSLNASIEAARAGDHGRGFAVVAGEIRNLANSSAESAKLIDDVIKELVANSEESVRIMLGVVDNTNAEHSVFMNSTKAFSKLKEEITNVSQSCENVNRQVDNLIQVRNEISGATESLSAVSEENAASTEETSASMQELSQIVSDCVSDIKLLTDLSKSLESQVSVFTD